MTVSLVLAIGAWAGAVWAWRDAERDLRRVRERETVTLEIEPISAELVRLASYTAPALKITISSSGTAIIGPSSLRLDDDEAVE